MRPDTVAYEGERAGHALAVHDAYARAEHMLRCYGVAYVCRHPELLLGVVPAVDPERRFDPARSHAPYESLGIYARPEVRSDGVGSDDVLMRIVRGYQMLDEIYASVPIPTRIDRPSITSGTSTSAGDLP